MSAKAIVDMFSKYNLISEGEEVEGALDLYDEDEDFAFNVIEMLSEIAYERQVWFSLGDCVPEDVIGEFVENFEKLNEASEGAVSVNEIEAFPPAGTSIKEDEPIKISFTHNDSEFEFSFSQLEPDPFINSFSKWAFSALNGGFLLINEDHPFGYCLQKEMIAELESAGITNDVSKSV